MSLKFLAVGQSFAGLRGDKSPYAVRKENQLPRFGSSPRFLGRQVAEEEKAMVQTDFLQEAPRAELQPSSPEQLAPLVERPLFQAPAAKAVAVQKPKRSWFSIFGLKWFRTQKTREELVQSELSLEKVRVLRNDLADSDLQLVIKRKKKATTVTSSKKESGNSSRQGWSELNARLFELGQR